MRTGLQRGNFSLEYGVKRKYLRTQRKLKALILLIALAVLGWVIARSILASPYFEIKAIRIEGTNRLPQEKLLKWANIPSGQSIFQVNLRRIAKRISSSPLVKRAEVKRILPSTVLKRLVIQTGKDKTSSENYAHCRRIRTIFFQNRDG